MPAREGRRCVTNSSSNIVIMIEAGGKGTNLGELSRANISLVSLNREGISRAMPWRRSEAVEVLADLPITWARGPEQNGVVVLCNVHLDDFSRYSCWVS